MGVNLLQLSKTSIAFISMFLVAVSSFAQPPAQGANKYLGNITTNGQVRSDFLKYWNQITGENEHKWQSVEGSRDRMNWGGGDRIANFATQNDILWKFHTLVWGSQYPSWLSGLSQADQLAEIKEWYDEVKAKYPDLPMIDVVNEAFPSHAPAPFKNALGGDGATGFDWIIEAFKMARERWPNAILIYNDYNNCEYSSEVNWTVKLVNAMLEAGAPIDAIGCQAHDAYKIATATVKANIDKLAETGLPIFITEYDIGEGNDARQKQIMEEQFTMFWTHPKIVGITYWGYIAGSTWRANTGLMSSSGTERPALTWLKEYVKDNPNPPNDFPGLLNGGGLDPKYRITVNTRGLGAIAKSPDSASYAKESKVTLTATPIEGWIFDSWSGDTSGKANPLTISVNKSIKITANFITKDGKMDLIENGGFSSGTDPWTVKLRNGEATSSVLNGEYKLVISTVGSSSSDIRILQTGIKLEQGKSYRLVFDAYATKEKVISANIGMPVSPKTSFLNKDSGQTTEFSLTTTKKSYSVEFTMEEASYDSARLEIGAGNGEAATVYLDNVSLFEIDPDAIYIPVKKNTTKQINVCQKGSLVNITFNTPVNSSAIVKIYDLMGNVISSTSFKIHSGAPQNFSLNAAGMPKGYYIVKVINGSTVQRAGLVITGK